MLMRREVDSQHDEECQRRHPRKHVERRRILLSIRVRIVVDGKSGGGGKDTPTDGAPHALFPEISIVLLDETHGGGIQDGEQRGEEEVGEKTETHTKTEYKRCILSRV